jgi:hypothetical protein
VDECKPLRAGGHCDAGAFTSPPPLLIRVVEPVITVTPRQSIQALSGRASRIILAASFI